MWWLLASILVLVLIYWFLRRPYQYWTNKGVKQGNPSLIFGDFWNLVSKKQALAELLVTFYNICPNTRYFGFYQFSSPTLLIKDPELIKQIAIKDFDHFVNHRAFGSEETDPLWSGNLFFLTGQKWREMRIILSPAFTSSKTKYMFASISETSRQFVTHFLKKKGDVIVVELRDIFTRFANDAIANTVFGICCDSLEDRDNEFYKMGIEITDVSGFWKKLKIFGYFLCPKLYKFLKIKFFSEKVHTFFNTIMMHNIEKREEQGIVRPDVISLLLEARRNYLQSEMEITDQVITSQALAFFFAGFDSVSSLLCFMSYELAVNPDVQQKLIQEVDNTRKTGEPTYEAIQGMKYMDMVVSESLRKWPNMIAADTVCTKPYTIEPKYPDEKAVHLEENTDVFIPIFAIHRDPKYFPEPDRFDPERFNDENKANMTPYTYLPFGVGPRNCIGSRFAILETKILFFHLLADFEIVPVEKTHIPVQLCKKQFHLTAEGGFWLGFKSRVNHNLPSDTIK